MNNLLKKIFFLMFFFCLYQNIFAYNQKDYEDIVYYGFSWEPLHILDLNGAPLFNENLDHANLNFGFMIGASFRESSLKSASMCSISASYASFRHADLEDANLTKANFKGAYFYKANLRNTKVKGADFAEVSGLTNKQKKYLRNNGALNVPKDLTDEEFDLEKKRVEEELRSPIGEFLERLISPILNPIMKMMEFTLKPVVKGTELILDYTLAPCINVIDKAIDKAIGKTRRQKKDPVKTETLS